MNTKNITMILALVGMFTTTSCKDSKKEEVKKETTEVVAETKKTEMEPNIVEVAVGNENFSTLVAAVKAADLVETLSGEGPFTVFAPTNDAFEKLPEGTVATLLKPENKSTLSGILTYHVVAGKFNAAAVVDAIQSNNGAFEIKTVQGGLLVASLDGENVMLKDEKGNMSKIIMTDVMASNGVIHAIETVVMPK
ncbi:fasciclin domain-containing protein [Polaribacter aestuariivivens]|uniref:Fasciclin domain-containing protein n=1 Tax=Polaribacter aestuariivivens TaxID=2304626 RepID=A0A5S3N0S0_9FLAO|nr:fasciclin domain-containing protein [Polaribacter aestuariivivens]TMM28773.1 fasciclin domain-containing protein [Polaribacter aestuariivivens]